MAKNAANLWLPPGTSDTFKKAPPPKMGDAFGSWAGRDLSYMAMPGGAVLQFDLSRLTLDDYRQMRTHYQINASLSVLTFMMHQLDWHIECADRKIATFIEANLREMWTRLIRALSQAYWAGYSPIAVQYENDPDGRIVVDKFKDLLPEESRVHWLEVEGWAPPNHARPKFYKYDGIDQMTSSFPIPPENTLWYPLLMENGDYYGRKLLKPAFPSWFFSMLIHLFANRYFERFGEPVPIGRADFEADVDAPGGMVSGRAAMEEILTSLRNRSVVTLPSDRDEGGNFLFDIEYLESQMRGADFERYLFRLDEEMSLGLFTPTLLIRTADVGSYNLGVGHMQMYLWMLNALAGDLKEYLDRYVVERLKAINFSPNAPRAEWVPRKLGKENAEILRAVLTEVVRAGSAKPDLEELGVAVGLSLREVREVTDEPDEEAEVDDRPARDRGRRTGPRGADEPRDREGDVTARAATAIHAAYEAGTLYNLPRELASILRLNGHSAAFQRWMEDTLAGGASAEDLIAKVRKVL